MSAVMTLAMLAPGQTATVQVIVLGALRALCGDIGIREGQSVRCRAGTAGMLVLDTEDGKVVSLARDWARYIRVQPAITAGAA